MLKNEGITLIALIITIIILLILAGVTIGTIIGDNSLINQTGEAKESAEIANEKEVIDTATVSAMGKNKYGDLEEQEFQNALDTQAGKEKTEVTDLGNNFEVLFVDSNRYYEVDANGNIQGFELGASDSYPGDITKDENGNELDGSEAHPYQINCIEDLVALSNMISKTGKIYQNGELINAGESNKAVNGINVVQTRDLNFKSKASYIDSERTDFGDINGDDSDGNVLMNEMLTGTGFPSIGKYEGNFNKTFTGTFDGNNHSIKNLYKSGLFESIRNSEIKNITVYGVEGETNSAGIIERVEYGKSTIINCINYINVKNEDRAGGIANFANNSGELQIINCINYGEIEGSGYGIGGLLGYITSRGNIIISNSCNFGNLNFSIKGIGYSGCGGFIGLSQYDTPKITIINCFSIGTISGQAVYSGNLIGNTGGAQTNFINSYSVDNGGKILGNGEYTGTVTAKTLETMQTQEFADLLNNYKDENGNYPADWNKWKIGENGYPAFVKESNN